MKRYKLELPTGLTINFTIFVLICFIPIGIYKFPTIKGTDYIWFVIITAVVLGMLWYLIKIKIAISKDRFCSVAIDKDAGCFIFTTKSSEEHRVNFNDVEGVYMTKGEVLRGLPMGYINVKTKAGDSYSLAITKIDDFCTYLPAEINKDLDENIFFKTNK